MAGDGLVLEPLKPISTSNGFGMRLIFGGPSFDPKVTERGGYLVVQQIGFTQNRIMLCPFTATYTQDDGENHIVTVQVNTFYIEPGCYQVVDLSWLGDAEDDGPNPAYGVSHAGADQLRDCVFLHIGSGEKNAGSLQAVAGDLPN